MKECTHDSFELYRQLIWPLRAVAKSHGYALAVHGTLKRDIDLIAVPWVKTISGAAELAEAIRIEAERVVGYAVDNDRACMRHQQFAVDGHPGHEPHFRRVWTFQLTPAQGDNGPYIDLSVMPRTEGMEVVEHKGRKGFFWAFYEKD